MANKTTKSKDLKDAAFQKLLVGHSDDDIASLAGVHRSTVARWRSGSAVPLSARRLIQLCLGGELPADSGEFSGFRIVEGRYLVAPGQHYQNAITADIARAWFFTQQKLDAVDRLQHENARLRADLAESKKILDSEFETRLRHIVGALIQLAYPAINLKELKP